MGVILALGATAGWAGNVIAIKYLTPDMPPNAMIFWRWVVGCAFILPFGLKPLISNWRNVKPHLPALFFFGLLGGFMPNVCGYRAPLTTTVINIAILSALSSLMTIFVARILVGEPITRQRLLGSAVAILGVVTLVTQGHLGQLASISFHAGDFWTLLSGLFFAVYSVTLRLFKAPLPLTVFLICIFFFCLMCAAPFYIWEMGHTGFVSPLRLKMAYGLLYMGIVSSYLSFYCWNMAVNLIGAVRSGIIYYLAPVFSVAGAIGILAETMTMAQVVGGVLVLCGVVFSSLPGRDVLKLRRKGVTFRT